MRAGVKKDDFLSLKDSYTVSAIIDQDSHFMKERAKEFISQRVDDITSNNEKLPEMCESNYVLSQGTR